MFTKYDARIIDVTCSSQRDSTSTDYSKEDKMAVETAPDPGSVDMDNWAVVFTEMCDLQSAISALQDGPTKPDPATLRTFFLALMVETGETLNELNWKPWKRKMVLRADKVLDEGADMMAFFLQCMSLLTAAIGTTPEALIEAYLIKSRVNVQRLTGQVENYGGDPNGRNV